MERLLSRYADRAGVLNLMNANSVQTFQTSSMQKLKVCQHAELRLIGCQ
jgi:hypothetical protein